MESIQAIYDGNTFKPLESIPVSGRYKVKIVFEEPIDVVGDNTEKSWEEKVADFKATCNKIAHAYQNSGIEIDLDNERFERINRKR